MVFQKGWVIYFLSDDKTRHTNVSGSCSGIFPVSRDLTFSVPSTLGFLPSGIIPCGGASRPCLVSRSAHRLSLPPAPPSFSAPDPPGPVHPSHLRPTPLAPPAGGLSAGGTLSEKGSHCCHSPVTHNPHRGPARGAPICARQLWLVHTRDQVATGSQGPLPLPNVTLRTKAAWLCPVWTLEGQHIGNGVALWPPLPGFRGSLLGTLLPRQGICLQTSHRFRGKASNRSLEKLKFER